MDMKEVKRQMAALLKKAGILPAPGRVVLEFSPDGTIGRIEEVKVHK